MVTEVFVEMLASVALIKHLPVFFECEDSQHVYKGDSGIA